MTKLYPPLCVLAGAGDRLHPTLNWWAHTRVNLKSPQANGDPAMDCWIQIPAIRRKKKSQDVLSGLAMYAMKLGLLSY